MSIPVLFTSYEDWKKNINHKIVRNSIYSKVKELTSTALTVEECDSLMYTIIETMQHLEMRDTVYIAIDKRIKKVYNMEFAEKDILDIMSDSKVYNAALEYTKNKSSIEYKEMLDIAISNNLIGLDPPKQNSSKDYKIKYREELNLFKTRNASHIIS
jgi:hypothetical protein